MTTGLAYLSSPLPSASVDYSSFCCQMGVWMLDFHLVLSALTLLYLERCLHLAIGWVPISNLASEPKIYSASWISPWSLVSGL